MHWLYTKREVKLSLYGTVRRALRSDKVCRERLHILSLSGDNVCRVRQNVQLRVHILSPATNCAGATKCAVTSPLVPLMTSYYVIGFQCLRNFLTIKPID